MMRIRRRRFGQLVISGAAASIIANLPRRVNAQKLATQLYGVQNTQKDISTDAAIKTPDILLIAADATTGQETSRFSVPSQTVENQDVKQTVNSNIGIDATTDASTDVSNRAGTTTGTSIFRGNKERITSLTSLQDGTLAVISVVSTKDGEFSRIARLDPQSGKLTKALKISGFSRPTSTLESLVATKDKNLIGIVSQNSGTPPFNTVGLEIETGNLIAAEKLALPVLLPNRRYSNLALATDGTIYGTSIGSEGSVNLIKIDLNDRAAINGRAKITTLAQLSLEKEELANDLLSLAISPTGQIYALANPQSKGSNSLYQIDEKSGQMSLIREFAVEKIAFA